MVSPHRYMYIIFILTCIRITMHLPTKYRSWFYQFLWVVLALFVCIVINQKQITVIEPRGGVTKPAIKPDLTNYFHPPLKCQDHVCGYFKLSYFCLDICICYMKFVFFSAIPFDYRLKFVYQFGSFVIILFSRMFGKF